MLEIDLRRMIPPEPTCENAFEGRDAGVLLDIAGNRSSRSRVADHARVPPIRDVVAVYADAMTV
jgi:hypothetical protein